MEFILCKIKVIIESDNTFIMHIKKTYLELGAKGVKTDEVDAILKSAVRFMSISKIIHIV